MLTMVAPIAGLTAPLVLLATLAVACATVRAAQIRSQVFTNRQANQHGK